MASELETVYLIAGDDEAKISAAIERLRDRAEREQGAGALERIAARPSGGPDLELLQSSMASLSLTATHRYILVEGAERAGAGESREIARLIASVGEDLTVVFVARGEPKPGLVKAVEAAEGIVLSYAAPRRKELPRWVVEQGKKRGIEVAPAAARMLIERTGERTARLAAELDRLALWADPGDRIERDDVAESVADDSEAAIWSLGDAIIERRPDLACRAAERLLAQGEAVPPIVYGTARSLRRALSAAEQLERGAAPREVERRLGIHPYAARKLIQRLGSSSADELREAAVAVADLEWQTRGGSERDERSALVFAVRRAAGAGGGGG